VPKTGAFSSITSITAAYSKHGNNLSTPLHCTAIRHQAKGISKTICRSRLPE